MARDLADGITIRFGIVGEAGPLATLAVSGGDPIDAEIIDALAAARRVFVAETDDGATLIGVAAVGEIEGALSVESLCVLPAWRSQGVGSALLTTVEEYGRWALFPQVLIVPRSAAATEFLFRRGWLSVDATRMPPELMALGGGGTVVTKRL